MPLRPTIRWSLLAAPLLFTALAAEVACGSGSSSPAEEEPSPTPTSTSSSSGEPGPEPSPTWDASLPPETPPLCTVPMTKVSTFEGRDIYTADVELEGTPATCVLKASTAFRDPFVPMQIGYLAGSPGYSIDARSDYEVTSVSPGTLRATKEAADVLEDQTITFTVRRRDGVDAGPDAGPNPTRKLVVRMTSDPDPSKWTLSLYAFETVP